MASDYLTIAGSQINMATWDVALDRCTPYQRGGIPELTFSRIVGKLSALPDAWSGKSISWSNGSSYPGTTYFSGTVVGYTDRFDHDFGWVRDYRALGLRNLADYVPVTDSNTLSDAAQFNMAANQINSIPARMGRTCGQAVLDILSMPQNAAGLQAYGIGNYTSTGSGATASANMTTGNTSATYGTVNSLTVLTGGSGFGTTPPTVVIAGPCTTQAVYTANLTSGSVSSFTQVNPGAGYTTPPTVLISTLPAATISDLANLTVISPFVLTFCGERILQSVESIIQTCHPNMWLHVDPAGNIRVFDQRVTTNYTVTLGNPSGSPEPDGTYGSRWMPPQLHRDLSDSYSQLIVRGDIDVSGITLSVLPTTTTGTITYNSALTGGVTVNTGGLYPDFAWGAYTSSSAAAAAYNPNSFVVQSLQGGQDQGSCTCSSTTQVVIQSTNTSLTLAADQLDQNSGNLNAILTVTQSFGPGIAQMFSTSVIANTSTTTGNSTLTVAPPLPATTYTAYYLTFSSASGNVVYRRYICTKPGVGAALQNYFPYPFAFVNADGTAAAMTSSALGSVLWSAAAGACPFNYTGGASQSVGKQPVEFWHHGKPRIGHDFIPQADGAGLQQQRECRPSIEHHGVRSDRHGWPDSDRAVRRWLRGNALHGRGNSANQDDHPAGLDSVRDQREHPDIRQRAIRQHQGRGGRGFDQLLGPGNNLPDSRGERLNHGTRLHDRIRDAANLADACGIACVECGGDLQLGRAGNVLHHDAAFEQSQAALHRGYFHSASNDRAGAGR